MPESKSGSNLRQINNWQKAAARAEYLRHPDASIAEVSKATNVAIRTVARARAELVKEGLLPAGRNATTTGADAAALALAAQTGTIVTDTPGGPAPSSDTPGGPAEGPDPAPADSRGSRSASTIDGEALRQMNELLDGLADEDDDTTRKRMLRQVKRFAFDPNLHPDTRMSASQLWAKLLDMQRAKDLGPGVPQTLVAAIARCTDFLRACGAKVAVPAFYAAFDLGDPNAPQTVDPSQPAPPPSEPAGPADDVAGLPPQA